MSKIISLKKLNYDEDSSDDHSHGNDSGGACEKKIHKSLF